MDDQSVDYILIDNPILDLQDRGSFSAQGVQDLETIMKVLTRVDLNLEHTSKKLVNLHVLLMHLLAWDNDLEVMAMSAMSIQKALEFDLLSGILDSTVRDVEIFVDHIQEEICEIRNKISCSYLAEHNIATLEERVFQSEKLLNESLEKVSKVKTQSTKLQRAFSAFRLENWEDENTNELSDNNQLLYISPSSKRRTADQRKHVLRMLEKSLGREIDLENKLAELMRNEEQLKVKLHHTEQVSVRMEEAAEVIWGRFLEAENAAEVLMGISKELAGRLQIVQVNINGSVQREAELNARLHYCIEQLDSKDAALNKLKRSIDEHISKGSEVSILVERVKSLEEQLKRSELRLVNVNALYEESQEQLSEMENVFESLKESTYEAENRAETTEAKVTQLTDTNVELTEEINFLKDSRDSNTKKVSLLEKQLREVQIQLQHVKASSEASQEQQNMLYSAIWDMETLIEDLKSKTSRAESKVDATEERCLVLSETNLELNKEIDFLRSKVKTLETSLNKVNNSKAASAKEINLRTGLIMDMVMQVAREREHIQNQLLLVKKENEVLAEKLRNAKRQDYREKGSEACGDNENLVNLEDDSCKEAFDKSSEEAVSPSKSLSVDKASESAPQGEDEEGVSCFEQNFSCQSKLEATSMECRRHFPLEYVIALFVALIAGMIVIYLKNLSSLKVIKF
ncbi:hypothetical protein K2173_015129 [Erythroxylum novogranatense]|uniref:WIT1/2 N-terminal helical bundle domain-containing protein n=1 Tax=Erythroxylum novogranatense TaxID=1862640 RepID=A0AAV8T117_9ROSI|nr:hypothetical protein K2173_015129 [Erythroxylum novogranatense]